VITRSKIADLPADERAELAEILAEARGKKFPTERFQSNADEASFVFYLLVMASVGGLIAYVVVFGNPVAGLYASPTNPALYALLSIPVGAYSLWRVVANFRGNGWALTSFGFVHVIRTRVQIVRFADIVRLEFRRFKRGKSIKLITRDGTSMHSYAGALLDKLVVRLPPEAVVEEL
jgi:hypothetical protein